MYSDIRIHIKYISETIILQTYYLIHFIFRCLSLKSRWRFISLIEICLQTCSVMLFISKKCISFTKMIYILQKYKYNSECTDTLRI